MLIPKNSPFNSEKSGSIPTSFVPEVYQGKTYPFPKYMDTRFKENILATIQRESLSNDETNACKRYQEIIFSVLSETRFDGEDLRPKAQKVRTTFFEDNEEREENGAVPGKKREEIFAQEDKKIIGTISGKQPDDISISRRSANKILSYILTKRSNTVQPGTIYNRKAFLPFSKQNKEPDIDELTTIMLDFFEYEERKEEISKMSEQSKKALKDHFTKRTPPKIADILTNHNILGDTKDVMFRNINNAIYEINKIVGATNYFLDKDQIITLSQLVSQAILDVLPKENIPREEYVWNIKRIAQLADFLTKRYEGESDAGTNGVLFYDTMLDTLNTCLGGKNESPLLQIHRKERDFFYKTYNNLKDDFFLNGEKETLKKLINIDFISMGFGYASILPANVDVESIPSMLNLQLLASYVNTIFHADDNSVNRDQYYQYLEQLDSITEAIDSITEAKGKDLDQILPNKTVKKYLKLGKNMAKFTKTYIGYIKSAKNFSKPSEEQEEIEIEKDNDDSQKDQEKREKITHGESENEEETYYLPEESIFIYNICDIAHIVKNHTFEKHIVLFLSALLFQKKSYMRREKDFTYNVVHNSKNADRKKLLTKTLNELHEYILYVLLFVETTIFSFSSKDRTPGIVNKRKFVVEIKNTLKRLDTTIKKSNLDEQEKERFQQSIHQFKKIRKEEIENIGFQSDIFYAMRNILS